MKRFVSYTAILVLLIFNLNCSYDNESPANNDELVSIKVKEYKTNLPLSGAKVSTYSCGQYDIEFGCLRFALFSSCTTDKNGVCKIRYPDDIRKLAVEKINYWPRPFQEDIDGFVIQPQAWVNISFSTINEYPSTSYFVITVNGEKGFENSYIQAANNSNSTLTLFGNEQNVVNWVLYETFNSASEILNSGSFTLIPNKFENLTFDLSY